MRMSLRLGLLLGLFLQCQVGNAEASQLVRQWSRSSLLKPYYGFRHLNPQSPILTDDSIIQVNSVDGLKAFSRRSGHELWSFSVLNGAEGAAHAGGQVFFGGGDGQFYALDARTGQTLWQKTIGSESLGRPTVSGNQVFHVAGNNTVFAFDRQNGEILWVKTNPAKSSMTVRGQSSPLVEGGVVYVGLADGRTVALNAQNGRELWSKRLGDDKRFTDVDSSPVMAQCGLLVSSFANALFCLDRQNGQIRWRHDEGGQHSVLVSDGQIFYSTLSGELHVLDEVSGKLLRKVKGIKGLPTQAQVLGEHLIYGETNGGLVVRERASLKLRHRFESGRGLYATPLVDTAKGEIYFASREGTLYRFDLRRPLNNPFAERPE